LLDLQNDTAAFFTPTNSVVWAII